jgi:hypothetical protein
MCHNPNFKLATKARACKGVGQEWSPRVTFHPPRTVGECEGMNPHIPKWALTLGVKVLLDFQIFRRQSKTYPNFLSFHYFHLGLAVESIKEVGVCQYELQFLFVFQFFCSKNIFFENFTWVIIHQDFMGFLFKTFKF